MYTITHENLLNFLDSIRKSEREFYAPQAIGKKVFFAKVDDVKAISFDHVQTTDSPKFVIFPRVENLISYRRVDGKTELVDHSENAVSTDIVLFGSRPCDAVALRRLAEFFESGTPDAFVAHRRNRLIVITMSCVKSDPNCFCASVGTSPGDSTGSDLVLTSMGSGAYILEVISQRGEALLKTCGAVFAEAGALDKDACLAKVEKQFTSDEIASRLSNSFDDSIWNDASLRCLGCGTCAYVCPVCSCFDIQDEGNSRNGVRLRCWDSCGFGLFTLHTSGHNPRPTQIERWRQRVMHKFSYTPEKYGTPGCTGCGRCSRACPVDMNMKEQLKDIMEKVANP